MKTNVANVQYSFRWLFGYSYNRIISENSNTTANTRKYILEL